VQNKSLIDFIALFYEVLPSICRNLICSKIDEAVALKAANENGPSGA